MDSVRHRSRATALRLGLSCGAVAALAVAAARAAEPPSLAALAERARGSVVEILGAVEGSDETSYGTGFVVRDRNLVVTNAHVVRGVKKPLVRTRDGATYASVRVLDSDEALDLAVLRVIGLALDPLPVSTAPPGPVGTEVVAVGHPRGYEFTVSAGIVSAIRALKERGIEMLQTTAPISPGSSGGPLLDRDGLVVGVCSLTLAEGQNINFAVPAREVGPFLERGLAIERALAAGGGANLAALSPEGLAQLVRRHRDEGDMVRAAELARSALTRHPQSLVLLLEAAEVAWSQGRYPEVKALLARIDGVTPGYPPARQIGAALAAQDGDCERAVRESEAALAAGLDAERAGEAHAVLAECLGRIGRPAEALVHVDQALSVASIAELPDYHALKAFLLQALGKPDEADRAAVDALVAAGWDAVVAAALRERGLPRLVEVVSQRTVRANGGVTVEGVVRNRGPIALREVELTAEGTDAAGTIVATGSAKAAPGRLVPGQTGSFRIALGGAADTVEEIAVRVVDFQGQP
ncbi:MAG: tetratricopeptide repeat-containing serine protease family protein [Acidobacteria bacterium]|nr:tetratricopeptide repeat-containing serine protease family protein [Acidobacteriota bacterium]